MSDQQTVILALYIQSNVRTRIWSVHIHVHFDIVGSSNVHVAIVDTRSACPCHPYIESLPYIHELVHVVHPLYMCTSLASWLSYISWLQQHHEVLTCRHNEEESSLSCP